MSRIKKCRREHHLSSARTCFPYIFFFFLFQVTFCLFCFLLFSSFFTWWRAEHFAEGRQTSLFVKFFFHFFPSSFFFFSVVLWFAIEHPFIMYWSWVPPPIPPHHSRCVTAPKRVGFFSLHFYIGWELKIVTRIGNFFFFYYFFFCLWRRDDTLFVSDENNKTYNLNSLFFLIYLCIIFFFPNNFIFFFILSVLSNVHTIIILFPVWW